MLQMHGVEKIIIVLNFILLVMSVPFFWGHDWVIFVPDFVGGQHNSLSKIYSQYSVKGNNLIHNV